MYGKSAIFKLPIAPEILIIAFKIQSEKSKTIIVRFLISELLKGENATPIKPLTIP